MSGGAVMNRLKHPPAQMPEPHRCQSQNCKGYWMMCSRVFALFAVPPPSGYIGDRLKWPMIYANAACAAVCTQS
jgi:hypothetical protein